MEVVVPIHPLDPILDWLPGYDFAVLQHGWTRHGRDYVFRIEDCIGKDPGQHELTFTHVVTLEYETRVRDDVWRVSWDDVFTNYERWIAEGEPRGYVWGTKWSDAYPGIKAIRDSQRATNWSEKVKHPMYEVTLETDRFGIALIFHSILHRKISDDTSTISKAIIPL